MSEKYIPTLYQLPFLYCVTISFYILASALHCLPDGGCRALLYSTSRGHKRMRYCNITYLVWYHVIYHIEGQQQ